MSIYNQWLLSTWVKTPRLRERELLIASACLSRVNAKMFEKLTKNREVLLVCPERESALYYGKIASIIRSSRPKRIIVVTVEGSPHCFTVHASVNEAEYILNEDIPREHYVLVDTDRLIRISSESVRVARYLHLVDKLVKRYPEILKELEKYSLEHKLAIERRKRISHSL